MRIPLANILTALAACSKYSDFDVTFINLVYIVDTNIYCL